MSPDRSRGTYSDDDRLVARLRRSDPRALDEILERYWAPVFRYAMGVVRSYDDAEDIAQDVFLALWEGRQRWHGRSRLRPLVFRIARNHCLAARRRVRVRRTHAEREAETLHPDPATPLQTTQESEFRRAIAAAVDSLPARQGEVFRLSRVHGLSHHEIAEVLGLSPQTVANHLTCALRALRDALSPHLAQHTTRPRLRVSGPPGHAD